MKAWSLEVSDVKRAMDDINSLGNAFAETNGDILTGMQKSAAALSATGTSMQDAFALFTGGQEILQNAESMGKKYPSYQVIDANSVLIAGNS